jgi:hypothetical protein
MTEFKAKLTIGVFMIVDASLLGPNSRSQDTDIFKFCTLTILVICVAFCAQSVLVILVLVRNVT